MSGGIFLIKDDETLVEMTEEKYDSEDLLQGLLEKYPNLLAGDQIDSETPRKWLLISREFGVPDNETGGSRWSIDHLFLDQDGVPTLVEVTVKIIWISKTFTDEHRAALDWLNRATVKGVDFFGVEVELWKIGDSNLAPKFNVVSKPNEWSKSMRARRDADQSERTAILSSLWTSFIDYIRQNAPVLNPPKPTGMPWIRFHFGDVRCSVSYAPSKQQMNLYLLFGGSDPIGFQQYIQENSEKFNKEIQTELDWKHDKDGIKYGCAAFDFNHKNQSEYEERFSAIIKVLSLLKKAIETLEGKYFEK
jgi:hypothetical protein